MRAGFPCVALLVLVACETAEISHRDSCSVCHRPRDANGVPHGIEDTHAIAQIACTECHGGAARICSSGVIGIDSAGEPSCDGDWIYDKDLAHISPGDGPRFLKNLSSLELDAVDPAYLQFINPGDLRVVNNTCGKCHDAAPDVVSRSAMTHTAGEIAVARYRASAQPDPAGIYGAVALTDPEPDASDTCALDSLELFDPDPADPATIDVAAAQDQYLVKSCLRCHLSDFGENRFQGDFRSSGCTACHMTYTDDGRSQSKDPRINKQTVPHPKEHVLTTYPEVGQCTHCHYRGGRIGISIQGYRESAGPGLNPPDPEVLGRALHGHDATYYLTDEDVGNDFDETPPDIHFELGMHCVDCHTLEDIHGNGHLYSDLTCAIKTECEDCHGTIDAYATLDPVRRPNLFEENGKLMLRTKVTDLVYEVSQIKDSVTPGHPNHDVEAELAMTAEHTAELECYTCHASWTPSCYGCHVQVDMTRERRYHSTGELHRGFPAGTRSWVVLNDLVLMRNNHGKIAPSMPAERFFMTVLDEDVPASMAAGKLIKRELISNKPRTFTDAGGRTIAGFGQRPFNPHTTRRRSQFSACDRCHSVGDPTSPDNAVLLDLTYGFGTQRFGFEACDVTNVEDTCDPMTDTRIYQLDALQTRAGDPLVVVGHPEPQVARPLTLAEIDRMRQTVVPADPPVSTAVPPGAVSDPQWPRAQKLDD